VVVVVLGFEVVVVVLVVELDFSVVFCLDVVDVVVDVEAAGFVVDTVILVVCGFEVVADDLAVVFGAVVVVVFCFVFDDVVTVVVLTGTFRMESESDDKVSPEATGTVVFSAVTGCESPEEKVQMHSEKEMAADNSLCVFKKNPSYKF